MAHKLAVQPWLLYWFCSAMQEAYFCPCWHSQETPLVLFYCFHFPVFICSFFAGWLFIMGPAEEKKAQQRTKHRVGGMIYGSLPCSTSALLSQTWKDNSLSPTFTPSHGPLPCLPSYNFTNDRQTFLQLLRKWLLITLLMNLQRQADV